MRHLLTLVAFTLLLAGVAGVAGAQGVIGVTFDEESIQSAVYQEPQYPFDFYLYIQPETASIGGYECYLEFDLSQLFILGSSGPSGWTNWGESNVNQLVGFGTPLPVSGDFVIVCTLGALVTVYDTPVVISIGPGQPTSFDPPAPGYADGAAPDDLYPCVGSGGIINEYVAAESRSLSGVKALFD